MRLLLDTVAFLWAANAPDRLARPVLAILNDNSSIIEVSAISLSEIAIKNASAKLNLDRDDASKNLVALKARVLPYTEHHAFQMFTLPPHHRDPFDRQLIAQALVEDIPVATPDPKFKLYHRLKVVW